MNLLRDYADWCQYAGIYLRNYSHGDRYRTYRQKLSEAGCLALVADEFLASQKNGINLQAWRSYDVYEAGGDLTFRIDQTARAFEAIGAPRIAAGVRTVRNESIGGKLMQMMGDPASLTDLIENVDPSQLMADLQTNIARTFPDAAARSGITPAESTPSEADPEIETAEEIARLLAAYVDAHADELRADMDRHGDPRKEPGFDPARRLADLDEQYARACRLAEQLDDTEKLRELIGQFEKRVAKVGKSPGKLASLRRKINELTRSYRELPADELSAEMQACLADVERFKDQYPEVFQQRVTRNRALIERMTSLGHYTIEDGHGMTCVAWSKPHGFQTGWLPLSVTVQLEKKKGDRALTLLLDACERLKRRFNQAEDEFRQRVLESFDEYLQWAGDLGDDDELELEVDAEGNPTVQSILGCVESGTIHFSVPGWPADDAVAIDTWIGVAWDEEHVVEVPLMDVKEEPAVEAGTIPDHVTFGETGPALSDADLSRFESTCRIRLPEGYREFLRLVNGGRPAPGHLPLNLHGQTLAIDVVRLFGIGADDQENDLRSAVERHRARHLPDDVLPIGLVTVPDPSGGQMVSTLYLRTSGSRTGTILVCLSDLDEMFPADEIGANPEPAVVRSMMQMFTEFCHQVASSTFALLGRLTSPPEVLRPDWLSAIREDDVDRFLQWHSAGGRFGDHFTEYGTVRPLTVVDALAIHATEGFLRTLLGHNLVRPRQLRESWGMWSRRAARFETLMKVLPANQYRYVFLTANVWDHSGILSQIEAADIKLDEAIDDEGGTPLHHAVMHGRPDGVRWLLEHGASASKPDDYRRTALVWAEDGRQLECLLMLLDAGESLESLFPHMPTMKDKLKLIESRWLTDYPALRAALGERGIDVGE